MDARSIRVPRRAAWVPRLREPLRRSRAPHRPSVRRLVALLVGLPVAALAILVVLGAGIGWVYDGRILPNVVVAGVDLSGATPSEAEPRLAEAIRPDGSLAIVVGEETITPSASALGRRVDVAGAVDAAMAVGRSGDLATDVATRLGLVTRARALDLGPTVDTAVVRAFVAGLAANVDRPAIDPMIVRLSDRWLATAAHAGHRLDRAGAVASLTAALEDPRLATTTIRLDLATLPAALTDDEAAAAIAAAERIVAPLRLELGDESAWTFTTAQLVPVVRFLEAPGLAVPSIHLGRLTALVTSLREDVAVDPVEARFLLARDGDEIGYVGGRNGRALDTSATAAAVLQELLGRRDAGEAPRPVAVATVVTEPELTAAEAAAIAPRMARVSTWTTHYVVSERNGYGANITIPARLIDGTIVAPGQTFDFWAAVGPVTRERGFRMGGVIQNGRTNPTGAIGGGICSASTTLFNAAIRAGLEIRERYPHYYYITRYPLGLDATVSKSDGGSSQNMRFRNDTPYPVYIRGRAGPGWVRFDLYTVRSGRTVTFSKPAVSNVDRADDPTQRTTSLPAGTTKRVEWPADGMSVVVVRTVRDRDGNVLHVDRIATRYHRVDGLVLIGTG